MDDLNKFSLGVNLGALGASATDCRNVVAELEEREAASGLAVMATDVAVEDGDLVVTATFGPTPPEADEFEGPVRWRVRLVVEEVH